MAEFDSTRSDSALIQIGTLSGNPVAAAAGLAAIRVLRQSGTYESLYAISKATGSALESTAADLGISAHIVGEGPIFELVFADEPPKNYAELLALDSQLTASFAKSLRAHGVLRDSKFYVSTAHDESDVKATAVAASKALADITR
jgi:glutamate-1-semialdehyde 2,1-aminomutase